MASSSSSFSSHTRETLLSELQSFQGQDSLPTHATHPFASSAEQPCKVLQDLIHMADQLSSSLSLHSTAPWPNPKLVWTLRQHSSITHSLHESEKNVNSILDSLRARSGTLYAENIPFDRKVIPDWCVSQLEAWGLAVGMESFRDESKGGLMTVVLGGKVLVIDVDFALDHANPLDPSVKVMGVKTSYAVSNDSGPSVNASGSTSLDAFLSGLIQRFCDEVKKGEDIRNAEEAARLKQNILDQLRYLLVLDGLADRKTDDGGIRWFADIDELCPTLEKFAQQEAEVVALSLSCSRAPLDIFLLRSHTLPLPYLVSPSISFLVHLSPSAYLSLMRSTPPPSLSGSENVDVALPYLRQCLQAGTLSKGATLATLSLNVVHNNQLFPSTVSIPSFTSRPTFSLIPGGINIEHVFPETSNSSPVVEGIDSPPQSHIWVLDFTGNGKYRGIVMSQSRMRDIELAVNPLSSIDSMNSVNSISFGIGSWVDLLLNPDGGVYPERYTALYRSPNSSHPPLQLRLAVPEEPGFVLERVPVHNMKEVWGVLEIVREQAWLNEVLNGCQWTTEGLRTAEEELPETTEANEEDLQNILSGTYVPRKLPVNVFLPLQSSAVDSLFGDSDLDTMTQARHPRIVMTSPERPPISGLVSITVTYDETRTRGVAVEIQGAMGADIPVDDLEEISRRGGTLGLPGRIWSRSLLGLH